MPAVHERLRLGTVSVSVDGRRRAAGWLNYYADYLCFRGPIGGFGLSVVYGDEFGAVHQGVFQADGAFYGAGHDAGAAVVAFSRVHDDGMPASDRRGKKDVAWTDLGAASAAGAEDFVVVDRVCAAGRWLCCEFIFLHGCPPVGCIPGFSFRILPEDLRKSRAVLSGILPGRLPDKR